MSGRVAVVGGGIAGLAAAYGLSCAGREFKLYEAGGRWGGIVETERVRGFLLEGGPDSWVSEKPWARELAEELGLEMVASNDAVRRTYVLRGGGLMALPDGMRMMVPTDLEAMRASGLFSEGAKRAYEAEVGRAEELRGSAPGADESVASFVRRHFGEEVCATVAAPMLAGILGGDVERLSVRAVMPQFVRLEREFGSLILGLQARRGAQGAVFTTLRDGMGALVDALVARLPPESLRLRCTVRSITRDAGSWLVDGERFGAVILAVPADAARGLLAGIDAEAAALLPSESSSAISVAFGFAEAVAVPRGFGFLAGPGGGSSLLACTFVDQKFAGRAPEGRTILRAFFGGAAGGALLGETDAELAARGRVELERVLGELPPTAVTSVRRWPRSMPQYAVGHLGRMDLLDARVAAMPGLKLVGNAYRGVGLPDLIRDGRAAARAV